MADPGDSHRDDADLLEAIHRGDEGAFDRFVDRFGDRIYGFGMRVCGEREDARDVAQDTLLQAFRAIKTVREPRALRSWLYRVASNACLMKRRKGKFEPNRELSLDDLLPSDVEAAGFEIPDDSGSPEVALRQTEVRTAVRAAVRTLPAHYRIIVVMRDMEQLSTREVAEILELPETTVKMRLHRGRLAVRKELERRYAGGEILGGTA